MDPWSPQAVTGLPAGTPPATATAAMPGIGRSAGPTAQQAAPMWSPDNPLFWVGGLLVVTFGLMAANVSIRVGPFKASGSAGKNP